LPHGCQLVRSGHQQGPILWVLQALSGVDLRISQSSRDEGLHAKSHRLEHGACFSRIDTALSRALGRPLLKVSAMHVWDVHPPQCALSVVADTGVLLVSSGVSIDRLVKQAVDLVEIPLPHGTHELFHQLLITDP